MSGFSREYQKQITGEEGKSWVQNKVKFDGIKDNTLIDAKGRYSQFVNKNTGRFYDWFGGKNGLIDQANRQIEAASGKKIQWYFAEEDTLYAVEDLFERYGINGIELIYEPFK